MIEKLHKARLRSLTAEKAGTDRADRWGITIGHWAPTFSGLVNPLRSYEKQ